MSSDFLSVEHDGIIELVRQHPPLAVELLRHLRVLKSRDLHITRAQRELIETCTDLARLDTWFNRSLIASTVDELFDEDEE